MTIWDANEKRAVFLDSREKAPQNIEPILRNLHLNSSLYGLL